MGHRWRDTDRSPTATASPTCTTNCSATSATCRRQSPFSTRWSPHGPHGSSSWRWEPAGWRFPSPASDTTSPESTSVRRCSPDSVALTAASVWPRCMATWSTTSRRGPSTSCSWPSTPCSCSPIPSASRHVSPPSPRAWHLAVRSSSRPSYRGTHHAPGSHVEVRSMTTDRVVLVANLTDPATQRGQRTVRRTRRRRAGAPPTVRASILATERARRAGRSAAGLRLAERHADVERSPFTDDSPFHVSVYRKP